MLSYPLKQTSTVDLINPLIKYFKTIYNIEELSQIQEIVKQYNDIRNNYLVADQTLLLDQQSNRELIKDNYKKYINFLWSLQATSKNNEALNIEFVWSDSLTTKKYHKQCTLEFQLFSCYYNLGIINLLQVLKNLNKIFIQSVTKKCVQCLKKSYYYLNFIKSCSSFDKYRQVNLDTSTMHLQALEQACKGIFYQIKFQHLQEKQYSSLPLFTALANTSNQHFQKAEAMIKVLILQNVDISKQISKSFITFLEYQSFITYVLTYQKFGKYFCKEMQNIQEKSKNIQYSIYFYKGALNKIGQGLKNQAIINYLQQNQPKKQQFTKLKIFLQSKYQELFRSNSEIYKTQQLKSFNAPIFPTLPENCIFKAQVPPEINISNNELLSLLKEMQKKKNIIVTHETEKSSLFKPQQDLKKSTSKPQQQSIQQYSKISITQQQNIENCGCNNNNCILI